MYKILLKDGREIGAFETYGEAWEYLADWYPNEKFATVILIDDYVGKFAA